MQSKLTNQLGRGLHHIAYLKHASFTIVSMETVSSASYARSNTGATPATNMAILAADVQSSRRPMMELSTADVDS